METNVKKQSILANIEYYQQLILKQEEELQRTKELLKLEEQKLQQNFDWGLET